MNHVCISEHESIFRASPGEPTQRRDGRLYIAERPFRRLRRLDERLASSEGRQIFDWRIRRAKARQWVGVMQVPGVSLEVLPKTEVPGTDGGKRAASARKNLLYMLSLTGQLPLEERALSGQAVYSAPLIEALIRIFAERLFVELNRGVERGYVRREENLSVLRGKLLFSRHVVVNAARRDRLYVERDEFVSDTPLNRIFRAACRRLVAVSSVPHTQERLGYCLMLLDDVSDIVVTAPDFERVVLNRQNERFRELFHFCRYILEGSSPAATTGQERTFSLFFDMNVVFESFVARFLQRYVLRDKFADCRCYPQATNVHRHLLYQPRGRGHGDDYDPERDGTGTYPLKADIVIRRGERTMIIDTKWKRLAGGSGRQGVSGSDLLQLYAYATRYESAKNVLLYPRVDDVAEMEFHLPVREHGLQSVSVEFLDLDRDLMASRSRLTQELRALVENAFSVRASRAL